jgi:RecA-family ATPase
VVLLSAEDGPEDTIKPRLEAAGANPEMIIDLSDITVGDKQRPPEIPADLELIESVVREHKAKLLIIEPLAAFLAGPDANKDQEIRRVLYKLSKIAERNNCTIIVLRHLNKSSRGGKGFAAVKRTSFVRIVPPPIELVDWEQMEGKGETKNGSPQLFE